MYNAQSNAARFIYTLNDYIQLDANNISLVSPTSTQKEVVNLNDVSLQSDSLKATSSTDENQGHTVTEHKQFGCILKGNKFWFSKEARSDEKVRFTETDMYTIIRTILFLYVFDIQPDQTMLEIVNTGIVTFPECNASSIRDLTITITADLVDSLFGENFSIITKRVIVKCFTEYEMFWRYAAFNKTAKVLEPSALDLKKLRQFVNVSSPVYSRPTQFINNNSMDNKIPLQNNYKTLY